MMKFIKASDSTKLDMFAKYGLLADALYGGAGLDLISNNTDTFIPLLSNIATDWALTERHKPIYNKAVQMNPRIAKIFSSENNVELVRKTVLNKLNMSLNEKETYDNVLIGLQMFGIEVAEDIEDIEDLKIDDVADSDGEPIIEFDDGISLEDILNGVPETDEEQIAEIKEPEVTPEATPEVTVEETPAEKQELKPIEVSNAELFEIELAQAKADISKAQVALMQAQNKLAKSGNKDKKEVAKLEADVRDKELDLQAAEDRLAAIAETAKMEEEIRLANEAMSPAEKEKIRLEAEKIRLDMEKEEIASKARLEKLIEDSKSDLERAEEKEAKESLEAEKKKAAEVADYVEELHGQYRTQIEELILKVWEEMYGKNTDGKELADGFIVPSESILGTGKEHKLQGILSLSNSSVVVKGDTIADILFYDFVETCNECGIKIADTIPTTARDVYPYTYNPMLQRRVASGALDPKAFKAGWKSYKKVLIPYIEHKTKKLAIERLKTRSNETTYKEISGYTISLLVVNYKKNLGTQIRICCGDTYKTAEVAKKYVEKLRHRESTSSSMGTLKTTYGDPIISDTGYTATISIYQNMKGYQAVPQFMGEFLCNLNPGSFKPDLKNMMIGVDLNNNIVTAPFTKWLLPIIASSRSGKGVLTLNMLLNVIGNGTPLFYLDGKPDMATLLWKLQAKYGIANTMVYDGIGYQGITDIDKKPYKAPYADNITKMMKAPNANPILESNYGVMIYLKTMLSILLACRYYKDHMGSKYDDLFVVFDEVYKVMKTQTQTLILSVETEIGKLDKTQKAEKAELEKIKMWISELLQTYIGNDIGVFGAGIKAVALTQYSQVGQYSVEKFGSARTFCENFLLKRGVKLYGRQEGGSGIYGVIRDKGDDIKFDYYDKYYHFGIGGEQGNNYNSLHTFKPLFVLNENDCIEKTGGKKDKDGNIKDGAFIGGVIDNIKGSVDINAFREKYFRSDETLSDSIGFEGALAQVGRLIGEDWVEKLRQSLSRPHEITEAALKFYGIIGTDNIESVNDYICSFDIAHLWSYNDIIRAKAKGISLGGGAESVEGRDKEESILGEDKQVEGREDSMLGGFEEESDDSEILDFGSEEKQQEQKSSFGGKVAELSKEEQEMLGRSKQQQEPVEQVEQVELTNKDIRDRLLRDVVIHCRTIDESQKYYKYMTVVGCGGEPTEEDNNRLRDIQYSSLLGKIPSRLIVERLLERRDKVSSDKNKITFSMCAKALGYDLGDITESIRDDEPVIETQTDQIVEKEIVKDSSVKEKEITGDGEGELENKELDDLLSGIRNQVYDPPEEVVSSEQQPVFEATGKTGKTYKVNPTSTTTGMKLTPENSVIVSMPESHPLEGWESKLFKTLKGATYEFNSRWNLILTEIGKRMQSGLVTRVMITAEEMYVNGRFVATENVIGGFENIRLEDLVDFKELFKKFNNITELTLDTTMVERFQIEQPELPVGFFVYSPKLLKVNILLPDGKKEVVDRRDESITQGMKDNLEKTLNRSKFEAVCASKNPHISEKSAGYQAKVLGAAKTFGGNSWKSISTNLTKENPSFIKAAGLGVVAVPIAIGLGAIYAGLGLFGMFKRK